MTPTDRLLAERACERLMVDYARFVDFGEARKVASLFTEDGWWEAEGGLRMAGRAEILAGFGRREGVTRRQSRHVCTNLWVDVHGADESIGGCYLVNYRHDSRTGAAEKPAPMDLPKFVGEYLDRYVRTPEGWRIASRLCSMAFVRATHGD